MIQREAVHQGMYNTAREEGKRDAIAGLHQAQQVQQAVDNAGQKGYQTGANEAAAQLVAGLNGQGQQPVAPNDQSQGQTGSQGKQVTQQDIDHGAQLVMSGEMDEKELDQFDAQYPGVKDAVIARIQEVQQSQQGQAGQQGPAGLNVA